jgi:hypothetical protein
MPVGILLISRGRPTNPARIPVGASADWYDKPLACPAGSGLLNALFTTSCDWLVADLNSPGSPGVWQTFVILGVVYFVFMLGGAFGYRVPPPGWHPARWTPPEPNLKTMITHGQVHLRDAHKTAAFWCVWVVLCMNVSAGIRVLSMASPMLQEIFGGSLIGQQDVAFTALSDRQRAAVALIAAGFAGLLSLFNIGGRFFWASVSDHSGRKATYFVFFLLSIALYAAAPWAAHGGSMVLFVAFFCIIL